MNEQRHRDSDHGTSTRDADTLQTAEAQLFDGLGLAWQSGYLDLTDGPVNRIRVIEVGDGPPVLFVHGAGMCGAIWAPLLAAMDRDRWRAVCVDLPGCGLTGAFDHGGVDLRAHGVGLLSGVIEAVSGGPLPVVANSLGATHALHLAAERSEMVSRLVSLGAPGVAIAGGRATAGMRLYRRPALARAVAAVAPPVNARMARRVLGSTCGKVAVGNVPDPMFDVVAAAMRISEPTMRSLVPGLFARGRTRPDLALTTAEWSAIRAPTLLAWGTQDAFQSPDTAADVVASTSAVELVKVPGGHHPWWDDPVACAGLVDGHLADQPSPEGRPTR